MRRIRWPSLLLLLGACGDDGGRGSPPSLELGYGPASVTRFAPPLAPEELVGDWFVCELPGCNRLDDEGLRFLPNGEFRALSARRAPSGQLAPASYCVEPRPRGGTYRLLGDQLKAALFAAPAVAITIEIRRTQSEVVWIVNARLDNETRRLRAIKIDPPRSSGDCEPTDVAPGIPGPRPATPPGS